MSIYKSFRTDKKTALRQSRRAVPIIESQSLRDKRNFTRATISEITNSRAYKPKHIVVIIIKSDFLAHDQYRPSYFTSAIAEIIFTAVCSCSRHFERCSKRETFHFLSAVGILRVVPISKEMFVRCISHYSLLRQSGAAFLYWCT